MQRYGRKQAQANISHSQNQQRTFGGGGVRLVGIDYLSVDAFERQDFPVHRTRWEQGS